MVQQDTLIHTCTTSGMRCFLYPKKEFQESMAAIVVPYGANDVLFQQNGEVRAEEFPAGVAHFIEHKLFAKSWGDTFVQFAKQGATANAFTDGERTVYYFTCQDHFLENLKLLVDMLNEPYFTEENVEKEKPIIQSEIALYDDRADWAVYYQMLDMMYRTHPVRRPIAGTEKSVQYTTADHLQHVYDTCYLPQNFTLICTGKFPIDAVLRQAETLKRKRTKGELVFAHEPSDIQEKYRERTMGLRQNVFQIGFKLEERRKNLKEKLCMDILMDIWAGESSTFFETAYRKKYIDTPLGRGYFCGKGYSFCAYSGTGSYAEQTAELLLQSWETLQKNGISQTQFDRLKRKQIGQCLRAFQSPSSIGLSQIDLCGYGVDLQEWFRISKQLHKTDIEKLLQNTITPYKMVLSVVR